MRKFTIEFSSAVKAICAVLFSSLYILIPWESISVNPKFADLDNYLEAIERFSSAGHIETLGGLVWFLSEPGWRVVLAPIGLYFNDPLAGLLLVSWFCAFTVLRFIGRRAGFALSLIVIFNPLVIDLLFSQVRSAFALSLLLIAIDARSRVVRWSLVFYACTVHTVSLVLVGCYFIAVFLERREGYRVLNGLCCLAFAVVLALLLSYGREALLSALGDRRAEYDVELPSILFVLFWMCWAIVLTFSPSAVFRSSWQWSDGLVVILFSLAFFMALFSSNGIRFVSLALPLLACSLNLVKPAPKLLASTILVGYQFVQFVYWF